MNTKPSITVPSTPGTPQSILRNPGHTHGPGIPSIPRRMSSVSGPALKRASENEDATLRSAGGLRKKAYHILSKTSDHVSDNSGPRRRNVSMPQTLPSGFSSTQIQIDIENDRKARGLSSPPIVDFTRFEDTYRAPRTGMFEGLIAGTKAGQRSVSGGSMKPALKRNVPASTATQSAMVGMAPHPASARKPDPRLILSSLENVLGESERIEDHLNAHELLGMHQLDQLDFEERDRVREGLIKRGKLVVRGRSHGEVLAVLGEPIRKSSIYASASVLLSGREHEIPIIVVNTIEELYRTGIYQSNLFRNLPNRARLLELINIYDCEVQPPGSIIRSRQPFGHKVIPNSGFGSMTSLHLESTPDICALLTTYISSLPEPILSPFLFTPIWDWCCIEDEQTESKNRQDSFGPRLSSIPLARTYTNPSESMHITISQLLLQLMPSPNFSLLVYMLAFFSQVALVREENGVGVEDLSRMYGGRIFGGDSMRSPPGKDGSTDAAFNTTQTRREGETMMRWFLRRWAPISDGLFDVVDDAKMGIFRRTMARRDSFGKDILPSWPLKAVGRTKSDDTDGTSTSPTTADDRQRSRLSSSSGTSSSISPFADQSPLSWVDPAFHDHSTPNSKFCCAKSIKDKARRASAGDGSGNVDSEADYVILTPPSGGFPDDTLDTTNLAPLRENMSASSTQGLDERLLDLSIPKLLNQTLFSSVGCQDPSPPIPSIVINGASPGPGTPPRHMPDLDDASNLTAHLEAQLEERTNSLTTALKDISKSKLEFAKLQESVRLLESELSEYRCKSRVETDKRSEYEEMLKGVAKERDDALQIVAEIWKIMTKN